MKKTIRVVIALVVFLFPLQPQAALVGATVHCSLSIAPGVGDWTCNPATVTVGHQSPGVPDFFTLRLEDPIEPIDVFRVDFGFSAISVTQIGVYSLSFGGQDTLSLTGLTSTTGPISGFNITASGFGLGPGANPFEASDVSLGPQSLTLLLSPDGLFWPPDGAQALINLFFETPGAVLAEPATPGLLGLMLVALAVMRGRRTAAPIPRGDRAG